MSPAANGSAKSQPPVRRLTAKRGHEADRRRWPQQGFADGLIDQAGGIRVAAGEGPVDLGTAELEQRFVACLVLPIA